MEGQKQIEVIMPRQPQQKVKQDANSSALPFGRALQFTPLATSVLPVHDRIPIPQICRPREAAKLTTATERKTMQQTLAQFPVGKLKGTLQGLLKGDTLAEFKFRQSPTTHPVVHQGPGKKKAEYALTSTAQMVYNMSDVEYRYSTGNVVSDSKPAATAPTSVHAFALSTISQSPQRQVKLESPQIPTPTSLPNATEFDGPRPVMVSIRLPERSTRDDLVNENLDHFKSRKSSHDDLVSSIAVHIKSQKDASDAVLLNFQNTLMEIFEFQDQLDAGSTQSQVAAFFDLAEDEDDTEPTLSARTLDRLGLSLKKLADLKRLPDLSVEHLRRLQRLCEPPIDRAQTINLRIPPNASNDDEEAWRDKMQRTEKGILSAAVCLTIIQGCPHEETLLYSDVRSWIPNVLTNVFETCLIPVVEARPDSQNNEFFNAAVNNKDQLKKLLESSKKLLDVVATVCADVIGMDSLVNAIEFLCAKLIFVQNAVHDKNSCLGIKAFEKTRKIAMSCLARLYARFSRERSIILDEVLSSLDKLPSNSRSARQYRLGNGKSIQLITALFMQLVQATALDMPEHGAKTKNKVHASKLEDVAISDDDEDDDAVDLPNQYVDDLHQSPMVRLQNKASRLFDSSAKSAHDIVMYLVTRGSKTTKSGDSPYRNILDLFIEDLVTILPDPEWPSSELMLRILARKMINLARNDKAAAIKNMALEALGVMGAAISAQKALISTLSNDMNLDSSQQSEILAQLCELAREQEAGSLRGEDLIQIDGPFAVVSRQLSSETSRNLRLRGACGYFLAHFAKLVARTPHQNILDANDIEAQPVRVANWLLDLIQQVGSAAVNIHNFDAVNSDEAELAYTLCILNVGFCSFFGDIVKTLASSLSSDSAVVRSRSLKSVVSMLETDSSLLDRDPTIAEDVFKCAADESALVRDSALSLIARFIIARPALQQKGIKKLLECASDTKVGVQRRAISHLKDVYLNDKREFLRSKISFTFLERTGDMEESVAELARKTLLDIWINSTVPLLSDPLESKRILAVQTLSMDIVRCVDHNPSEITPLLQKFLVTALKSEPKTNSRIRELCSKIVIDLFEKTISGVEEQGPLHTLAAFAAADSRLIQPDRLAKLQSYLGHIKNDGDLFMFRSVIGIYCSVLPDLSATHKPLLAEIQTSLMKAIPNLGRRAELDPLMSCLHTIDGVLKNTLKLVKFTASVFNGIRSSQESPQKLTRLLRMAGSIARYLDLEGYKKVFSQDVKDFRGTTIADYMGTTFVAFAQPGRTLEIRALALEGLGSLCQAAPIQFNNANIRATLFAALSGKEKDREGLQHDRDQLQSLVLRSFDELYAQRAQTKTEADTSDEATVQQELGKLGGDSKTRDGDSAVVIITREVVSHVLKIALSSQGDNAIFATRTLSSISHEGLIHPKQSTGAFVALGTSPDVRIAEVATRAHKLLHQTHESVCEREYMHAVQEAFEYQRNVIGDSCGGLPDVYSAKLANCFQIINTSNAKYVKKFLGGLIAKIANDLATQDQKGHTLDQVLYARFLMQNLAFFDYSKIDDLLHTILQLELAYSKNGGEVVQALEQTLPSGLPMISAEGEKTGESMLPSNISDVPRGGDLETVRRLAPLAATLTLLMETRSYLVRQYAVGRDVRAAISNHKQLKESGKAPVRVHGITGERIWNKTNEVVSSLSDDGTAITCCRNFISLMSMDEDIEVEAEENIQDLSGLNSYDANISTRGETPGARKRKGSASVGNTPAKKQRARPRKESRRSASMSSADDLDGDYEV